MTIGLVVQPFHPVFKPSQPVLHLFESPVDLFKSPTNILKTFVDLIESLLDSLEALSDLFERLPHFIEAEAHLRPNVGSHPRFQFRDTLFDRCHPTLLGPAVMAESRASDEHVACRPLHLEN